MEKIRQILGEGWSITFICVIVGFILSTELRQEEELETVTPEQRIEELSAQILKVEKERDDLQKKLSMLQEEYDISPEELLTMEELRMKAGLTALEGSGVIVRMDDSNMTTRRGENPNLYVIHDEDILRIVNELRAAGAEAISINGQRLTATSEIRCAGPTLSVNNVRSAPPFEVIAIGDKNSLENSIKMRGGVEDALKVWGIQIDVKSVENVYIPPYKGDFRHKFARVVEEKNL
ncbi:MAG: DUF881 domain-containing protein [Selenomonadaceae bacterium]|nr:DUF881 domain-containing protein [Selenomonadaceae bacterium]